jgi:hypothetical protein
MKKIISILLSVILVIAFTGCEKEKSLKDLIVGKWLIKSTHMIVYENDVKTDEVTENYTSNEEEIEIFSNGTGKHYSTGVMDDEFTWSLDGSILTVTTSTDVMPLDVSVDGDTLIYKISQTEVYNSTTYKYEITYTATRIGK